MKSPTVVEVSREYDRMSPERWSLCRALSKKARMKFIVQQIRKRGLGKIVKLIKGFSVSR